MAQVRLLTAVVPPLLSDIVRALTSEQSELELVAQINVDSDLISAADEYHPDVVITSADSSSTEANWENLLMSNPQMKLLTISADGREAQLWRLSPNRVAIYDVSAHELLDAILGTGRYAHRETGDT